MGLEPPPAPAPPPRALLGDEPTPLTPGELEGLGVVRKHLERILRHTENLLKFDGSGERVELCLELERECDGLEQLPHAREDPHAWAIRQVEAEVAFLCMEWTPETPWQANTRHAPGYAAENQDHATLESHLGVLREVLATYEQALVCMPGHVACVHGNVTGERPDCACRCLPGWGGAACDEDTLYSLQWVAQAWGPCPGKGRGAEALREVGCQRSDGRDMADSECERRLGEPPPPRVQDCCEPLMREELPSQPCGDVPDGCGGWVSFGGCAA